MSNNSYFLGVDGGGSKTTAVVFNEKVNSYAALTAKASTIIPLVLKPHVSQ